MHGADMGTSYVDFDWPRLAEIRPFINTIAQLKFVRDDWATDWLRSLGRLKAYASTAKVWVCDEATKRPK